MAAEKRDTQLKNALKFYVKGYLVSKKHKTKSQLLSGLTFSTFHSNNIHMTKCRRHTGNKYGGQKAELVSVWQVLLTFQRCKTVIVCFRGCGRHESSINTIRIFCKSIF